MTAINSSKNISTNQSFLYRHYDAVILFLCWALVQFSLLYQYGIATDMEAHKYITEAKNIISNGTVSTPNFWLYSVQIFLIAGALKLKTGFVSVYIIQLVFNGLATWSLYRYIRHISDKLSGIIITLFFIFNFPFQTFNSFLQTESLFYSFTILFSCYLFRLSKFSVKSFFIIFLFLFMLCFTRPTGILFIPCAFLYLFFKFSQSLPAIQKVGITAAVAALFLFGLNKAIGSGGELDLLKPFLYEHIICGLPTLTDAADINAPDNFNSVQGLVYYITHNFEQFMSLAWLRTKAFFGLSRSYYSTGHNVYLYLYFFPFYLLGLLSIKSWFRKNKYVLLYCAMLGIVTWAMIILTCDDWHNRFFLTLVPYMYILSVPAVHQIVKQVKLNK